MILGSSQDSSELLIILPGQEGSQGFRKQASLQGFDVKPVTELG